ncbi:hypothetical protein MNBD_GAMMA11-3200 [hydrothermal vent metagenome]|uniref:Uncharacterized protein n=1 Tax=hydrothermal vent metagenome TaxID=652676 RepID=A0A3B0XEB7_9ZZZZ
MGRNKKVSRCTVVCLWHAIKRVIFTRKNGPVLRLRGRAGMHKTERVNSEIIEYSIVSITYRTIAWLTDEFRFKYALDLRSSQPHTG